jgi:hypothetical protein
VLEVTWVATVQLAFAASETPVTLIPPATMVAVPAGQVVPNDPAMGKLKPGGNALAATDMPDNGKGLGFESVRTRFAVPPDAIVVGENAAVTTGATAETVYSK